MTRPDCRRQGLAKRLMEEVLRDWADRCDGMFLFANETVLDFYPQFGFRREIQYQYTLPVPTARGGARKLSVDSPQDLALLRACYKRGNPFSALQVVENFGLLMFYCGSFLKDCVYYIPQQNAVAVARQEGPVLQCMDIFGGSDLEEILSQTAAPGTERATLGFAPAGSSACCAEPISDDSDALFVLAGKENPFSRRQLHFPDLFHT